MLSTTSTPTAATDDSSFKPSCSTSDVTSPGVPLLHGDRCEIRSPLEPDIEHSEEAGLVDDRSVTQHREPGCEQLNRHAPTDHSPRIP
jgi:hypothetical protein